MLDIKYEYEKGIFFVRLSGILNSYESKKLKEKIIPLILLNGFKYVVLNLQKINFIDKDGINVLNEINESTCKFNGKLTIIKNKYIKEILDDNEISNKFYDVKNENIALGVFEL